MMTRFLIPLVLATTTLFGAAGDNIYLGDQTKRELRVNNRILANINGKLISVLDVMKKMDVLFFQQFPEYAENTEARYQFYQFQWKRTLKDLIDKELILADAEENKLPVTNGDVRQEMEYLFGPNILANLDKIGMTYDQALEMLRGDILLKRMLYLRVNAKAMREVTPQRVREAYEEFAKENQQPGKWTYQFVSVRHPDSVAGAQAAEKARELLNEDTSLGSLDAALHNIGVNDHTRINVSDTFVQTDQEVNPSYLEVLNKMAAGDFSKPVKQNSRDNSIVYRIFHLISREEGGAPSFKEVEKKIEDQLLGEAMDKESDKYLTKLRQHYGISDSQLNELVSEDFEPFELN